MFIPDCLHHAEPNPGITIKYVTPVNPTTKSVSTTIKCVMPDAPQRATLLKGEGREKGSHGSNLAWHPSGLSRKMVILADEGSRHHFNRVEIGLACPADEWYF